MLSAVLERGGGAIVTADHGNAEEMLTPDGGPQTAHSLNPVPFVVTVRGATLAGPGILADVAPTALALLGHPAAGGDDTAASVAGSSSCWPNG